MPAIALSARPLDSIDVIVDRAIATHEAETAPFFDYLDEAGPSFSAAQFDFFRANFFYRTQTTTPMLQLVLDTAVRHRDFATAAAVRQTLYEECGSGDESQAHPLLLERSHNTHARTVFGLPPLRRALVDQSPLVIDKARAFRAEQSRLYESDCYATLLGASLAQETAALRMLQRFRDALFLPYASRYRDRREFDDVRFYFDCHLDGVEQEHAARARDSVRRACSSAADLSAMQDGVVGFLAAQASLWRAMLLGLQALDAPAPSR